jgi:hypothetical protein
MSKNLQGDFMKKYFLVLCLFSFTALAQNTVGIDQGTKGQNQGKGNNTVGVDAGQEEDQVFYYYGNSSFTAIEGNFNFGKYPTLVKRTISEKNKKIEEIVIKNGAKPGEKPKVITTTLIQDEKKPNVFHVTDSEKTFKGTMEFKGKEWQWNSWKYDLVLIKENNKITGEGTLNDKGIQSKKIIHTKEGNPLATIKDELEKVDESRYNQERTKIGI